MTTKVFTYQNKVWPMMVFGGLVAAGLCLLVGYFYLIDHSVWQVVASESLERELNEAQAVVAALEAKYLNLSANLDYGLARELGLVESDNTHFVTRPERLSSNVRRGEL